MKKDPQKLLKEAHDLKLRASGRLDDALRAWLEPYNFPAEIEQGFSIDFLPRGENIVTYNGRGEFDEYNQLENLIGLSYDQVIELFNC